MFAGIKITNNIMTKISIVTSVSNQENIIILADKKSNFADIGFSKQELTYIKDCIAKKEQKRVTINQYRRVAHIAVIDEGKTVELTSEACRRAGSDLLAVLNSDKINRITVMSALKNKDHLLAFAEGLALGNYQFLKYKKDKKKLAASLKSIRIQGKEVNTKDVARLNAALQGSLYARTLVNEPLWFLTATQLSKEIQKMGKESGFKVQVFSKSKIQSLRMGGLLAVNKGSIDPPTFTIMEWKPKGYKNKKPYVLVGKGVVFDTGGLSLKPTPKSMDFMKCDMGGAAAVAGAIYAVSKAKLPVHVIGLVPATDNRPSGNAYVPGDVITMHDGTFVEVLNTDAEGRLILADALSYAKRYKPELVIDLATLTGSSIAAIGTVGMVSMHEGAEKQHEKLRESGHHVHERLAELPFWDEYGEMIKSEIADIKNLGGPYGGSITAGKFLHHFTDYPWIHLDIAGPAFLDGRDSYRGIGGTGVGVRLLFDFFVNKV